MKKKEMQTAAKELNKLLNPTPKIDPDGKKLKDQLIEAGSLIVEDDLDELGETTKEVLQELEAGPFEKDGQDDPNKMEGGKKTHEANPAPLQQHTTLTKNDDNEPEAESEGEGQEKGQTTDTQDVSKEKQDVRSVIRSAKKLAELKDVVRNYDEFKKLRKKLDDYSGLQGPKSLKKDMVALLGESKESKPETPKKKRTTASELKDKTVKVLVENPKRPGSNAHERFKLYKNGMTVEEYLNKGGNMGDVKWDLNRNFIELQ